VEELDPLLHQSLRTQLVAFLAGAGEATFSDLKRQLNVSDGNLDSHLKKLIAAKYVRMRRDSSTARLQSCFSLTTKGRSALAVYVQALQKLLPIQAETGDSAAAFSRDGAVQPS
jgi:DNA-binding MarR family transcriptional regulator